MDTLFLIQSLVDAPWYVRNEVLHRDLKVDFIENIIKKNAVSHEQRLIRHVNNEASRLLNASDTKRRLKRKKPGDLARS